MDMDMDILSCTFLAQLWKHHIIIIIIVDFIHWTISFSLALGLYLTIILRQFVQFYTFATWCMCIVYVTCLILFTLNRKTWAIDSIFSSVTIGDIVYLVFVFIPFFSSVSLALWTVTFKCCKCRTFLDRWRSPWNRNQLNENQSHTSNWLCAHILYEAHTYTIWLQTLYWSE